MISPGPWEANCDGVAPSDGQPRIVYLYTGRPLGNAVDDARLIDAAPELLNTAKELIALLCGKNTYPAGSQCFNAIENARKTIGKVEGNL